MNCPICIASIFTSRDESNVARTVYRCGHCRTSFQHVTASGQFVEMAKVTTGIVTVLAVFASLFTGDW